MKLAQSPVAQQPTQAAAEARRGPTLINPADFKFVAGGSPRNGWQTSSDSLLVTETQSPRNGW